MEINILPLFKSHYSLGRSIMTLDDPKTKSGKPVPNSIFHLLNESKMDTLVLVDDNVSGLIQASKQCKDLNVKLIFGVKITVLDEVTDKSEESLKKESKYIIFVKNYDGYKKLIKIWSFAAKDGFYYQPRIDFKNLKALWDDTCLALAIPFYDSFLHLNSLESNLHVPMIDFTTPVALEESNNIPYDEILKKRVDQYASANGIEIIKAQSIYYPNENDFLAYLAIRCLHKRTTIDKPELNHMTSNEFNFNKWLKNNKA